MLQRLTQAAGQLQVVSSRNSFPSYRNTWPNVAFAYPHRIRQHGIECRVNVAARELIILSAPAVTGLCCRCRDSRNGLNRPRDLEATGVLGNGDVRGPRPARGADEQGQDPQPGPRRPCLGSERLRQARGVGGCPRVIPEHRRAKRPPSCIEGYQAMLLTAD